jgi:hypothetical protein
MTMYETNTYIEQGMTINKNEGVVGTLTPFTYHFTTCFGLDRPSLGDSLGDTQMATDYI